METSDIEMEDVSAPCPKRRLQPAPQRSEAKRQAYKEAQRLERDRELDALEDAWNYLANFPPPNAMLINDQTFPPRIVTLLGKGRRFLPLARRFGMSQAAKIARNEFKQRGRDWTGAQQKLFDARLLFNQRVMGQ